MYPLLVCVLLAVVTPQPEIALDPATSLVPARASLPPRRLERPRHAGHVARLPRLFGFYDRVVPEEPYLGVRRVFLRPVSLEPGPRRQRAVRP
ncbi:MAG TPA: hypothetical protein VEO54_13730 [Thermoanaerobaculia bacterium]|nr:hypothetical protein [Thermoanaerobaculia bacterium]